VKVNEKFDVSLWGVLGFIGLVVVVSVVATLTIAGAEERSASTAIATKLTKDVGLDVSERQELVDLRTKVEEDAQAAAGEKADAEKEAADAQAAAAEETDQLKDELSSAQAENKKLTDTLAAVTADSISITVPTGQARFIDEKRVAVGVISVSGSFATVRLGDYSNIDMYPGESRGVQVGDKNFVVTLMKIDDKGCVFAVRKA
jgi:hypothetical protein